MNNRKRIYTALSIALCSLFFFCACGQNLSCEITLSTIPSLVEIHTELQKSYLAEEDYTVVDSYYAKGDKELSLPNSTHFEWSAQTAAGKSVNVSKYVLELSPYSDFSQSLTYQTDETELDVYNLMIGTEYYWRVSAEFNNGKRVVSNASDFVTNDVAPRNIYVDGVTNVRDLGGWKTENGGRVKQGMMYRCGRLNESQTSEVKYEITPAGIATMRDALGIRSEIDFRMPDTHDVENGGITSSPLGEDINYYNVPIEWSIKNYLTDANTITAIKRFFELAADENNYPIAFHCHIGTDRTGLFAFLVNGLLGVSEDNLYRDYLFSNFGNIGDSRKLSSIQNSYVKTIKDCEGETFSQQIYNCLKELGVSETQLNSVIAIMTED